jgi:AraC-like DNA-binding protein
MKRNKPQSRRAKAQPSQQPRRNSNPSGNGHPGARRNSRLDRIKNWPELFHERGYSPSGVANGCEASIRTLQVYFRRKFGEPPSCSMAKFRMKRGLDSLGAGASVKATSILLAYKDPSHFSRDFKRF